MSKKRSFFERLAGNLRFDDEDEDLDEMPAIRQDRQDFRPELRQELRTEPRAELRPDSRRATITPERERDREREVPIKSSAKPMVIEENAVPIAHFDEEIGELPVDVYETPNEIIIQTLIAGVLPEHLSINITRDNVTITGRREENRTITEDNYHIRELYWGSFGRVVHLPAEVEIDSAEAIERHGMLMIKLPKIDKQRKTTLKIKSI